MPSRSKEEPAPPVSTARILAIFAAAFTLCSAVCPPGAAEIPTEWQEVAKITSPDPFPGVGFGQQMAFDGETIVVGVDGQAFSEGAVFVFEQDVWGRWVSTAELRASDGGGSRRFGAEVDVDGDTIAVAAIPSFDPGEIYIFERDESGHWVETRKLVKPDPIDPSQGLNIPSLSGDVLAVGASDDTGGIDADAVYIFERDLGGPGNWGWRDKLVASDAEGGEFFAFVDLDGDRLVSGAPRDHAPDDDEGSAYVFERYVDGSWSETAKLNASDGGRDDEFGLATALEGDVIVVGAPFNDEVSNQAGAAYIFELVGGMWHEAVKLTPELGDTQFGSTVAIDNGVVVVGAGSGSDDEGAIYVYEKDAFGSWLGIQRLVVSDGGLDDGLGEIVAIAGDTILGSDDGDDELGLNTGAFWVFSPVVTPSLAVSGACPGEVTFSLSESTPSGTVAMTRGARDGTTIVPGGPCPGLELDLEAASLLQVFGVDTKGEKEFSTMAPAGACGMMLQAVDVTTCSTSDVTRVP